MKTKFLGAVAALAVFAVVFPGAPASAGVIFADNFDSLADIAAVGTGNIGGVPGIYTQNFIPGWSGGVSAGVDPVGGVNLYGGLFKPSAYGPTTYTAPSFPNVAYTGNGNGSREFIDTGVGPVTPGTKYALSVDVGDRFDVPFVFVAQNPDPNGPQNGPTGYRIELEVCNISGCYAPFVNALNPVPLTPGNFSPATVSGVAPLGENGTLVIVLGSGGYSGETNQIGWDNVVLSAAPEISTWAMMLIGFAGIGFVAYRRAKKNSATLATA